MSSFRQADFDSTYSPSWVTGSGPAYRDAGNAFKSVLQDISLLDLKSLGVSEYNQVYIQKKLKKPHYEICVASYMLGKFLNFTGAKREDAVLIDHGAGSGLACFAAKRLNIKHVIYCDIFEQSCKDAKAIGDALGITVDSYICGDLPEVQQWIDDNSLQASGIVSHNVIEHVYSMDELFSQIHGLSKRPVFVWLSTAANEARKKTKAELAAHAIKVETQERQPAVGHKARNALQAYREIRRSIITEAKPELSIPTVNELTGRTRGMRKSDILLFLEKYREGDPIPIEPDHPTNTCDPLTGNWAERMMDPHSLVNDASQYGIDLEVLPGLWSLDKGRPLKNAFKRVSNIGISLSKTGGLSHAPYYILCGTSAMNGS